MDAIEKGMFDIPIDSYAYEWGVSEEDKQRAIEKTFDNRMTPPGGDTIQLIGNRDALNIYHLIGDVQREMGVSDEKTLQALYELYIE